jgi:hypothetical protein
VYEVNAEQLKQLYNLEDYYGKGENDHYEKVLKTNYAKSVTITVGAVIQNGMRLFLSPDFYVTLYSSASG